ncbi:tyrosine-type recombinase/integrase [Megasphaera sp. UBA4233]|uniref:tyrosine-type recombinase/integrase n=1 Tax=Megasphaera sp. UBA4233 TaxID=1946847 RepID=UPI0025B82595|nr:site-specific integrase [Megasphaera sp. UBA4233]
MMNKQELEQMCKQLHEMSRTHYKGETIPVNTYIAEWLEAKGVEIKRNTWKKYDVYCRKYFYPAFDGLMLTELTKKTIQDMVRDASLNIAPRTIQDMINSVLKPILKEAVGEKMIESNPAEYVKLPKVHKNKKETALTDKEVMALFSASKDHYQWLALPLMFFTGMRRSELLALRWEDINMDKRTIFIHSSIVKTGEKPLLTDYNKTEESTRIIPISPELFVLIQQYRATYGKGRKIVIGQKEEDKYMDPDNFSRTFRAWKKKAGITRNIGVHAYRHTLITICLQQHLPYEYIMAITGHTDPRMITHYADLHRADGAKAEVVQAVEQYIDTNNLLQTFRVNHV